MTKASETETKTGDASQIKDPIEKVLVDTFNELLFRITETKLHPSEQVNRDNSFSTKHLGCKIYDYINIYHGYCKLCEQHFYSRTVTNDINSFFQKHINTSYHRQIQAVFPLPDTSPIITWEDKLNSGRCNLCDMSDLTPYIIDTEFDVRKLLRTHICLWDQASRETNEGVLRKFSLLKKYCGLKIFREKFIKTIMGKEVCLLCITELPWSQEKAVCHLISDSHYQNFCRFVQSSFSFSPKDILNGFNLELITRALITRDLPLVTNFICFDERKICVQQSNSLENPYSDEQGNFSFSVKQIDELLIEENDYVHNQKCLLCNKVVETGHMSSELHQSKAIAIEKSLFQKPENYFIFLVKQTKRIRMNTKYQILKKEIDNPPLPNSPKKEVKHPPPTPFKENYIKILLKNKMDLMSTIFTVGVDGKIFCQMCDHNVSYNEEILHLTSPYHKAQEEKWKELKAHSANEKFTEPFQKVKNLIVCYLCGAVFEPNKFFSHLKGGMHARRFEWYCNQKETVPISSAFAFKKEFFCYCTICDTPMSRSSTYSSLKTTLKNIRYHWPCRNNKPNQPNQVKPISETNKTEVEKNLNPVQSEPVSCSRSSEEKEEKINCEANAISSIDFKKVEKTVEGVVNVFEKKITQNVLDKSAILLRGLRILDTDDIENDIKENSEEEAIGVEDPLRGASQSLELPLPSFIVILEDFLNPKLLSLKNNPITLAGDLLNAIAKVQTPEKETEQKPITILKNESRVQKTENNVKEKMQPVRNLRNTNLEKEHEVLVIEGLPKNQRHSFVLYEKFKQIGKVRYVFFRRKKTLVAFEDCNAAEIAAKAPDLFKNCTISIEIYTRKDIDESEEKPVELHKDLVLILQDLPTLVSFSLNMIVEAIAASESLKERKREEFVCTTIIGAILQTFPLGRCYPFGSRVSGLSLTTSDLDVFLDCGGMYEGFKNTTPNSEKRLVNRVAGLLRQKREITQISVIDKARVPIVSFVHKPTLMHCDLSFKNGLSVQNTLLINFMVSLDKRVRPLILFLKQWAKLNGLHGPPHFSSYAIAMLVIYYLQQLECPVLPTIEHLQNIYVGKRRTIGGWDCSINVNHSKIPASRNMDPFPKLLAEFFEFYSVFDYETNVISPLTGKPLRREAFSRFGGEELPMCYKRHILNLPVPIENLVPSKIPICIVDPFELSHVLTKTFTNRGLDVFVQLCSMSAALLKKAIKESPQQELKLN